MSGPLNRLVNRALGEVQSRLRPRAPSLFEPTHETAPQPAMVNEIETEQVAASPRKTGQPLSPPAPLPRQQGQHETDTTAAPQQLMPVTEKHAVAPDKAPPEVRGHVKPPVSEETQRLPRPYLSVQKQPSDAEEKVPIPAPIEPDRALSAKPAAPPEPAASIREVQLRHTSTEEPHRRETRPFLPSASEPAKLVAQSTQASAEPDIHIHIGRLEVRTAPAQPAARPQRQKSPKRASASPPLSDYLKDRGG